MVAIQSASSYNVYGHKFESIFLYWGHIVSININGSNLHINFQDFGELMFRFATSQSNNVPTKSRSKNKKNH